MTEPRGVTERIDAYQRFADRVVSARPEEQSVEDEEATIGARFEQVASENPERDAIHTSDGSITYGALSTLTNQIAHAALDRAEPGDRVVILAGNPIDAVAAVLGTLKAGLVHTAIEVNTPRVRIQGVLEDTNASLVISDGDGQKMADGLASRRIKTLDLADVGADSRYFAPDVNVSHDDPSHIIYTSGSTGLPKGIVRRHGGTVRGARRAQGAFGDLRRERLGTFGSVSSAASASNVYLALLNGATLMPFDAKSAGLSELAKWIKDAELTSLSIVPTLFRALLATLSGDLRFPSVRMVRFGGEPLYKTDIELYRRHFPEDCFALNAYAATECGVVSQFFIDHETVIDSDRVPAGYPMPGKEVYVLGEEGEVLAPGNSGEIVVGGGLSEYWNRPELSDSVFRPNPMGRPGLVYHAGDLGAQRPDGCIDLTGRSAFRVNVHGYSVEPAEAEIAMRDIPEIEDAAVVGRRDGSREEGLVGYYAAARGEPIPTSQLRDALLERIPAHAVPTTFVHLPSLPLTRNGKVDKSSLPDPDPEALRGADRVEPRDELEAEMIRIWSTVLGLAELGVNEDFWDLGGTSIQGLQVCAQIATRLGEDVPPTTLLEATTVAALAAHIREGIGVVPRSSMVKIQAGGSEAPFFCVHGGGGGVFFLRGMNVHMDRERPVYGLQIPGFDRGEPGVYRPIEELAARYVSELSRVQPKGPYLLGGLSMGGLIAWEMAQQLTDDGEEVALVVLLDTRISFLFGEASPEGFGRYLFRVRQGSFAEGVRYLAFGIFRRTWRSIRRAAVRVSLARRQRLPAGLRKFHYFPFNAQASRNYRPRPYQGRVLVIAAEGSVEEHRELWGPLCESGFEIHEVLADHFDMMEEPHVRVLVGHVEAALEEAVTRRGGRNADG